MTVAIDMLVASARIDALEAALALSEHRALELQSRNDALIRLAVATQRLGAATEREVVLDVIAEIVVDLVGAEHMAVFQVAADDAGLEVVRVHGVGVRTSALMHARRRAKQAMREGRTLLPHHGDPTTIIPLTLESTPLGAIAIVRLLEHKRGFTTDDLALLEVLRHHAAQALFFTAAFRSTRPTLRPRPLEGRRRSGIDITPSRSVDLIASFADVLPETQARATGVSSEVEDERPIRSTRLVPYATSAMHESAYSKENA